MENVTNNSSSYLKLETINFTVENLGKTLHFMKSILGFKFIRYEVSEYGMQVFLESNTHNSEKSIKFCIKQDFYGEQKDTITFGLRSINKPIVEVPKFNKSVLENFIIEDISFQEVRFTHLQELENHYPFLEEEYDNYPSPIVYPPFCSSYLNEIQIRVDNIDRYKEAFLSLGFNIQPVEVELSGVRNVQVVFNMGCNINLRLVENKELSDSISIKQRVSFVIASNTQTYGKGSTFVNLYDILSHSFTNEVFDKDENVISDYAEFVDEDGIHWMIYES